MKSFFVALTSWHAICQTSERPENGAGSRTVIPSLAARRYGLPKPWRSLVCVSVFLLSLAGAQAEDAIPPQIPLRDF
ncbi:MAG TPA: hypothetical protein VE242_10335, partial [Chthoniobacterales bacterium]|nr:hypothetical protein [Chthoniobacterales bacterium]